MTDFETMRKFFKQDIFATETTGIELTAASEGYAKCSLSITPAHLNAAGTVMGGAIYTLADFAFAVAANYDRPLTVTLSSHISFLNTPKGKTLFAEAKTVKDGRKAVFIEIDITDELGTPVAKVSGDGFRKS